MISLHYTSHTKAYNTIYTACNIVEAIYSFTRRRRRRQRKGRRRLMTMTTTITTMRPTTTPTTIILLAVALWSDMSLDCIGLYWKVIIPIQGG